MINKKILKISFACILGLVTLASCNTNNGDEEWYGVGLDVDLNSRTSFLVGEKVDASMFNFSAYDNGEEVDVKPEDITIEPNRSLELGDKQLTFKWKKYSTTLDINVSDTLISECELMEKALFKYTEPKHDLNNNGTTPDPSSSDPNIKDIDQRKASRNGFTNKDGNLISYLNNVTYGSNFSYSINTDNEGDEIYIYASVASNSFSFGDVSLKYRSGVNGSNKIYLSDVFELTNNGKVFESQKSSNIEETIVTEEDLDNFPDVTKRIPYYSVLDLSMCNFERRFLGKVTLEKGNNEIKIEFNKEKVGGCSYAYQNITCGNWDNIEIDYVKKGQTYDNSHLKVVKYPKQSYLLGEKISLDGMVLMIEDDSGKCEFVDNTKVTISNNNALKLSDNSFLISYNGKNLNIPITVKTKVIGEMKDINSPIKYIEPIHDRTNTNELVGENAENVDKRSAQISTNLVGKRFLENASAYGKFEYKYISDSDKGKIDIYASVASNGVRGGDVSTIWPGAKEGFIGSKAINFSKFMTLKNNGKEFIVSEDAYIPETRLTSDMDPKTIGKETSGSWYAWSSCLYFLTNNFRRIHIGTVDISKGENNVVIDLNYYANGFGFGYCNSMCGNWENIEVIYSDDTTNKTVTSLKMRTAPKTQYAIGEKFSLDGAEFIGYNSDGMEIGKINNEDIIIVDNNNLYEDTKVELRYQEASYFVDVKVTNIIKQELNNLEEMTIKYCDVEDESDTRRAALDSSGSYLEKLSNNSYFEYAIESDKERTISISAEVATNAYLSKSSDSNYKDYDTGIEGFTQNYIGSYDLDLSKIVTLTNTINDQTTIFETNKDAIAYGHVLNAKEDAETAKKYKLPSQQWAMADDLCMKNFKNIELGEIKLSKGKNIVRISLKGYL